MQAIIVNIFQRIALNPLSTKEMEDFFWMKKAKMVIYKFKKLFLIDDPK